MLGDGDIQKIYIESGKEHFSNRGRYLARFIQLFVIARVRRATLAAFVVMIAQQLCGSTPNHKHHNKDELLTLYKSTSWLSTRLPFSRMHMPVKDPHSFFLGVSD